MRREQHSWMQEWRWENLEQAKAAHWALQHQRVQKEQGARYLKRGQLHARGKWQQQQQQQQEQEQEQEQWQGRQRLLQAWSTCSHRLQCSRNTGHRMMHKHRR